MASGKKNFSKSIQHASTSSEAAVIGWELYHDSVSGGPSSQQDDASIHISSKEELGQFGFLNPDRQMGRFSLFLSIDYEVDQAELINFLHELKKLESTTPDLAPTKVFLFVDKATPLGWYILHSFRTDIPRDSSFSYRHSETSPWTDRSGKLLTGGQVAEAVQSGQDRFSFYPIRNPYLAPEENVEWGVPSLADWPCIPRQNQSKRKDFGFNSLMRVENITDWEEVTIVPNGVMGARFGSAGPGNLHPATSDFSVNSPVIPFQRNFPSGTASQRTLPNDLSPKRSTPVVVPEESMVYSYASTPNSASEAAFPTASNPLGRGNGLSPTDSLRVYPGDESRKSSSTGVPDPLPTAASPPPGTAARPWRAPSNGLSPTNSLTTSSVPQNPPGQRPPHFGEVLENKVPRTKTSARHRPRSL